MPYFFGRDDAVVSVCTRTPGRDGGCRNLVGLIPVSAQWWPVALLMFAMMSCGGCDSSGNAVAITGRVLLDGNRIPAEIQIEQLDEDGTRVGRATTTYAGEGGQFSASIERLERADGPVTCSLVVRVSQMSRSGLPAAFDESAPREKTVRLTRVVRPDDFLTLLLTR